MRSSVLIGRLTADLLTRAGAIVDSGPVQALDVMAEPALRAVLGLREFERLSFESGVAGATFIDYDASLSIGWRPSSMSSAALREYNRQRSREDDRRRRCD